MASTYNGMSKSISIRSPSFQVRCKGMNFPGAGSPSTRLPLTDTRVLGPAHAGIRKYTVNDSGLAAWNCNCVVLARGYSVTWVMEIGVPPRDQETRDGRNRFT